MNADEIIRAIEQLPEAEFARVCSYLAAKLAGSESTGSSLRETASITGRRKSFEEAADHVFREHRELLRLLAQ